MGWLPLSKGGQVWGGRLYQKGDKYGVVAYTKGASMGWSPLQIGDKVVARFNLVSLAKGQLSLVSLFKGRWRGKLAAPVGFNLPRRWVLTCRAGGFQLILRPAVLSVYLIFRL